MVADRLRAHINILRATNWYRDRWKTAVFGRGVTDMKVFLAQMLLSSQTHLHQDVQQPLVYIFLTKNEEQLPVQGSKVLGEVFQVICAVFATHIRVMPRSILIYTWAKDIVAQPLNAIE